MKNKINKLIPFVDENFITFPLWEEGKYIPFINIWLKCDDEDKLLWLRDKVGKLNSNIKYRTYISTKYNDKDFIFDIQISPWFVDTEDDGYMFLDESWAMDEMVDILVDLVKEFEGIK